MDMNGHSATLIRYTAPHWAQLLKHIPDVKIQLGQLNTPIQRWSCPGIAKDVELYIKRDDMTGSTLTGNKVRKLEFIMAQAVQDGCKHIITCGGLQSNFVRSTAVAARQLGMKPHLVLRSEIRNPERIPCSGNLLIGRMLGSDIHLVPRSYKEKTELIPKMEQIREEIREASGEKAHVICVGGSDLLGLNGYISAWEEMIQQNVLENFDDVVVALGSGGTAAGLAIGNYLTGSKLKIHAMAVCDDAGYFHDHINKTLQQLGLESVKSERIVDIIDGYKGLGYGLSTQIELGFLLDVAQSTGIILDPTYTAKAAYGLVEELESNRGRFKGNRILFIHTGGLFGGMDGRLGVTLQKHAATKNIKGYK